MVSTQSITIFTDGACSGNPGPGGWGSIIALPDGKVVELGGSAPQTTNNRMEMAAAIHALATLSPPALESIIVLYTDSTYLIRGITQWIWGWRARGWKSSTGKDIANRELWEELLRQVTRLKPANIDWKYVRGHSGYPGNERCDVIAVSYAKGNPEKLYSGPQDGYFVDLNELPSEQSLPELTKGSEDTGGVGGGVKKGGGLATTPSPNSSPNSFSNSFSSPITYLSYYGGVLTRHSNWASCERLVKGRNAKFKKAKSPQEERDIIKSWGLDPDIKIE
jgi:ribonuclease HI